MNGCGFFLSMGIDLMSLINIVYFKRENFRIMCESVLLI